MIPSQDPVVNPVTTTSYIVTSAFLSTVKKFNPLEFPSKTTYPSEIIDNFLSEMASPRLSALEYVPSLT